VQKQIVATHNHDLTPLKDGPAAIDIGEAPPGAKSFCFHGEFAFFFTPYQGAWAKEHFETCTVHRFDSTKAMAHRKVADYKLDGHYCNAAVGAHRFFALSWWPYEDEAMRAIWESTRQLRSQEKVIKAKDSQITALANGLKRVEAKVAKLQRDKEQAIKRKKERAAATYQQKQTRLAAEEKWRKKRAAAAKRAAWNRAERFRYRDPIHMYALEDGRAGTSAGDWRLVLDYHKGAHALEITPPTPEAETQRLRVTEHRQIFEFKIVAPEDLKDLGPLPVVPGRLCDGF
jgi:hypothetical protein